MKYLLAILIALGSIFGYQNSDSLGTAPRILTGQQGGTGIGSAAAGDVGKFLKVSDDSPLTYVYDTASGGSGAGNSKWATSTNTTDIQPNSGQGLNVNASSTFTGNLFSKGAFYASSTSLFTNGLMAYASSTWQRFTATFATTSQATTTNFAITNILGSLLKTDANGSVIPAVLGTDYVNGSGTNGNCVQWGAANVLADAGAACGGVAGSGTVNSGLTGQVAYYASDGTAVTATSSLFLNSNHTVTTANSILAVTGANLAFPGYTFSSDTDTGMSSNGANALVFKSGGTNVMTISGSSIVEPNNLAAYRLAAGAGSISATNPTYTFRGDTTTGIFSPGSGTNALGFSNTGKESARFTNLGFFGLGTTTPFAKLSIAGSSLQTEPLFAISSSTATATSTAFLIDSMGNVAIGTTSPQYMLEVAGAATTTVRIDSRHGLKGSCLMLRDTDGVGFTYVYVNDGVLTASQTPCN